MYRIRRMGLVVVMVACAVVWAGPVRTASAAAVPVVTLTSASLSPLIGESVTLDAAFDNAGVIASDTGYGPYVDLLLDSGGADGNDGVTFTSASYISAPVAPLLNVTCTGTAVTHPLTGASVPCPVKSQLVVLQLPFGSFTPDQPVAHLTIVANVSSLADVGAGLAVTATPGFAYGNSPIGNTAIPGGPKTITYVPQVVRFTKTYVGPELETATGPNYPRKFRLSADVANGQIVQNLTITDRLPKQYAYLSIISQSAATIAVATPLVGAPSTVQNTLTRTFVSNVVGTTASEDAFVEFQYFIPDTDANGATIVDHATGDDVATTNDGQASGTFVPSDVRDASQPFTINPNTTTAPYNDNVIMTAKSIAIQKSVTDLTHGSPIPGDTLSYTLDGQVSDYFTFNNVVVDDVLGDGQTFDASFVPVLQVTEAGVTYTVPMSYTVDASQRAGCGAGQLGTTLLHFDVSSSYATQDLSGNGVLTGGRVNGANTGPATYRIVFHTKVDDAYVCKPTPNNPLDPRDAVGNSVTTSGEVFDNASQAAQSTPQYETDDSGTEVTMAPTSLEKSIWARNGVVGGLGSPAKFAANDTITYEFTMHLPSADVSNLRLDDYLPLPVLKASAMTQGANCTAATAPALDQWCYGPNDTFHTVSPAAPTFAMDATSNSLSWIYGDRELPLNQPRDIQIMFTSKISNDPFRDGLFLTNQVQSSETNSLNPTVYVAPAIVQIVLTEPSLKVRKGVVATSVQAPVATFTGTKSPTGITFKPVGDVSCASETGGPVSSTSLANGGPNANVSGLDASDVVRFAIVVENTGTGTNGAFDTTVSDAIPVGFQVPASGLNLCITDGAGTVLGATKTGFFNGSPTTDPLGTGTIQLTDSATGALAATSPTSGKNVAVITYDLQLVATTGAGTAAASLTNTAKITNYAGAEGGPSFVPVTPIANLTDTATVATKPITLVKTLVTTDQVSTTGSNVAIGERVQYKVTVTIPEGVSRNVAVVDTLPAGLAISQAPGVATIGSSLSAAGVVAPVVGANGATVGYTFGDVTNSDTDNTTTANETITITYWAVVLDVVSNQSATTLKNSAKVSYFQGSTGATVSSALATTTVTVVEPDLKIAKSASASTIQADTPVTYTIVVSHNSGSIDAFEAALSDTIPAGLNYVGGSLAATGTAPTTLSIAAGVITATWTTFPTTALTTITFDATVNTTYGATLPISNTASVAYTSLPGSPTNTTYNSAGVERTGVDGTGGLNDYVRSSTATVQPLAAAIVKSLFSTSEASTSGSNVTIGEQVTYDLLVTLPDSDMTGGFTVTDQIPDGLQYVSSSIITTAAASPLLAQNFGATLPLPTVTGGASNGADVVYTFGHTTVAPDGNPNNNSFLVRLTGRVLDVPGNVGFTPGQTTLNNVGVVQIIGAVAVISAVVATPVVEPHLAVTKSFNPVTASQGDTVTVTLSVKNNGLSTAHEVIISDPLDGYFDEVTAAEGMTQSGFTYSRSTNTITYTGGSIGAGATATFTFNVNLDAVVPIGTAIPNIATVTQATTLVGTVAGERNEPNVQGSATLNSVGPDLQITKDDGKTSVAPGASSTYSLVVTNSGGFQATGVYIDDTLPVGSTFVSVGGALCTDSGVVAGKRRILISGAIPAGGSVTCTMTIAITSPAAAGTGSYVNTAATDNDGVNGPDPTPTNNTATDTDTISGRAPNLVVTKDDGVTTLATGASTTYTITVTNTGNIGVTNVLATDTLPAGLSYVSCSSLTGTVSIACAQSSGVVTISYAQLAGNGGSASFTVTATVNKPLAAAIDSVDNVVAVVDDGANGAETSTLDNTANDVDTVTAVPDMSVIKTHTEANVRAGGTVHYTLTVANSGDQDATGVVVTDTVDSQMVVNCTSTSPVATSCNSTTGVITWGPGLADTGTTSGPFRAGANRTLSYVTSAKNPLAAATSSFTNNVTVDDDHANGADPTPGDNLDSDIVPLAGNAPELGIIKTDGVTSLVPGGSTTYTLTVTNSGDIAATGVVITDTLPAGVTFASCTAGCTHPALPIVKWAIANIAGGGGTATVTITVAVDNPVASGITSIVNPASVIDDGLNGVDPVPSNNFTSDTDLLPATPDLVVTKTDGATTRNAGEQFDYTITVSNVGNQNATNVVVVDTLPAILTAVSCPVTPVPCTIGSGATAGEVTWELPSLDGGASLPIPAPGSSVTLTVTVVLDTAVAAGRISFVNSVRADDDGANGADPTPSDNAATDTDTLIASPDLTITKTDARTSVAPGDTLTYAIVVNNVGSQTATGVTVSDTLPPGVTFVSCSLGCDSSALPLITWANLIEATPGSPIDAAGFDAGGQATLSVIVKVDSPATAGFDDIDNSVAVADDNANGADPTPTNNSAHDVDTLNAAPDLGVTKTDGVKSVVAGQTVTYDVTVTNHGNQAATGVVVTDVLPSGLTFVSCTALCDFPVLPTVTWTVGNLAVGQSYTFHITATVDSPVAGSATHFVNHVTVADDGTNGVDPTPGDNSDVDDDTAGIDLAVTKTDGKTEAIPGTDDTYTIVVTNNGPTTIQSFQLIETLPNVLSNVTYTPSAGTYDAVSQQWTGFGDFTEGSTLTLTVQGTIDSAAMGTMTNVVSVVPPAFAPDRDPTNNTATDVDTLTPSATLIVDKQLTNTLVIGQTAHYSINVRNDGPSTATNVIVTDPLPVGLVYVGASGSGWSCTPAPVQTVVCTLAAALEVGQSATIELSATVASGAANTAIVNVANVSSSASLTPDSVLNDSASGLVTAPPIVVGPLPTTGADSMRPLSAGAALFGVGVVAWYGSRRRRTHARS